jgi:hypothetical protein
MSIPAAEIVSVVQQHDVSADQAHTGLLNGLCIICNLGTAVGCVNADDWCNAGILAPSTRAGRAA